MASNIKYNAIRIALLGIGLAAWAGAGKGLHTRGSFEFVPNAFSLKGSPFGRTLAMAMQGPADVYFHQGEGCDHGPSGHSHGEGCGGCSGCAGDGGSAPDHASPVALEPGGPATLDAAPAEEVLNHDHLLVTTAGTDAPERVHGEACADTCAHEAAGHAPSAVQSSGSPSGLRAVMLEKIRHWRGAKNSRTNPIGNSEAHKFFIRMEVEKKLFLTYEMDPTNYASYGAYYLFLSEASLGTRTGSAAKARQLAEFTVGRCLRERENPVAMLTAAAASHDMVQILVGEGSSQAQGLARNYAAVTSQSLDQFDQVSLQMLFNGTWDCFSPFRQEEMTERARLLRKLHEADRRTLESHVAVPTEPEGIPVG